MADSYETTWRFTAEEDESGQRLDRVLAARLADQSVSRGRVQAWISQGLALVDNVPAKNASQRVEAGQELVLTGEPGASPDAALPPDHGPLPVLYEDEHLVVVDKPAGISTHPAPGEQGPTLAHRLVARWPDMAALDPARPGIVHRLDKPTTGVMAAVRTEAARLALSEAFAERRTIKHYLAIVHGRPGGYGGPDSGIIEEPIGRDPKSKVRMAVAVKGGRPARSDWQRLWTDPRGRMSLVAVRIHTGRTHQVRVHMAHLGHPLIGDDTYGPRKHGQFSAPRVMLHALRLGLDHPITGEPLVFRAPVPKDMLDLLSQAARACLKVGVVGLAGSGKSSLMKFLEEQGAPVFRADDCVAELYGPGGDGAAMIQARFGGAYTAPDGSVDKRALLGAMLESETLRREVMDLVHPMVEHRAREFFAAHEDAPAGFAPAAFAEVALLLEGGWPGRELVDAVAGVWCPESLRTGVFREQRGLDPAVLAAFDSWQWPGPDKIRASQLVVDNSGSPGELRDKAKALVRVCAWLADRRQERETARISALIERVGEQESPA